MNRFTGEGDTFDRVGHNVLKPFTPRKLYPNFWKAAANFLPFGNNFVATGSCSHEALEQSLSMARPSDRSLLPINKKTLNLGKRCQETEIGFRK